MAEKAEKPAAEEKGGHGEEKKKGGIGALLTKLPVLIGLVMFLEAIVLFVGMKFLMGGNATKEAEAKAAIEKSDGDGHESADPHAAAPAGGHGDPHAAGGTPAGKSTKKGMVELPLADMRAPNKQGGRAFIYDFKLVVVIKSESKETVEGILKSREGLIKDRIRTIIAQSDQDRLSGVSEPGLETLRRQIKYTLDEVVGPDLVKEVLIERWIPFRAEF